MTEEKHMSRAELAAAAGVPDDAIVFWIRQGLLQSETSEPRKHHRFIDREARIAAILGELRLFGMNVGGLREVAQHLRRCIDEWLQLPSPRWNSWGELGDQEPFDSEAWERYAVGGTILAAEGHLQFVRTVDDRMEIKGVSQEIRMPGRSGIVVDLNQVLEPFADISR